MTDDDIPSGRIERELTDTAEVLAAVADLPGVAVEDYDVSNEWDSTTVDMTFRVVPPRQRDDGNDTAERYRAVKHKIDALAEVHDDGAPIEKVVEADAYDDEMFTDDETVAETVTELRTRGELYEAVADHLRTV